MQKYLNLKNNRNYEELKEPAKVIKNGGIVIFPTETVYGIGVNAFDEKAVKKLYEVKKRPFNKQISVLVSNLQMIEQITENITDMEYNLIKFFLPGPLTIVLKQNNLIPDIVTAKQPTDGMRIPSNEIALKLIQFVGVPIATTSANISGKPACTNLKEILADFGGKVDYIIDGGQTKIGIASTIVQVIDNVPHILRKGPISEEKIKEICK